MNSSTCLNTHVKQCLHVLFLMEILFVSTSQSCLADKTELTSDCQFSSGILKKEVSWLNVNSTHIRLLVCVPELLECLPTFIKMFREKRRLAWFQGRRKQQPTPGLLPRKFHGWRSLVGYSPWGCRVPHNWVTWLSFFLWFQMIDIT